MMKDKKNKIYACVFGLTFFIFGLITITQYGINWDTINHLPRGQAYLHFFLTGNKDYSDMPEYKTYWQKPESLKIDTDIVGNQISSRSYYQNSAADFNWFMENDGGGHPPISDILSSVFNRILFGQLKIINDIDSYRIYGLFLAACLVGLVYYWVSSLFGGFSGFVSTISLSLYPLFWSESHFNNEKDIPETVFWAFLLFSFWKGFTTKNKKWILVSGIFFGLALGTKFNILFIPLVIIPWLLTYWINNYFSKKKLSNFIQENKMLCIFTIIAVLIGSVIFFVGWPYLWPDPLDRILSVVNFYKEIGTGQIADSRFVGPFNINLYPIVWIATTSQPILIILSFIGIISSIIKFIKDKDSNYLLFLLWLGAPILRVVWPGTTIYGGIRQIMEYIPAMAIMAGLGAGEIVLLVNRTKLKKINTKIFLGIFVFMLLLFPIIKYHPNENVYFNFLIGGLKGAKEKNIPSWGNSFGAAYRQGAIWINKNVPQNSTVAFAHELSPNMPRIWLRSDIDFNNRARSGYLTKGEYAMTLTYEGTADRSYYDSYLDRFLTPVYELNLDGASILKVWKNSQECLNSGFTKEVELKNFKVIKGDSNFIVDLGDNYRITKIESDFNNTGCSTLFFAYSMVSSNGKDWKRIPGTMPGEDWNANSYFGIQPTTNHFVQPYAAEIARYVKYVVSPSNACLLKYKNIRIWALLND